MLPHQFFHQFFLYNKLSLNFSWHFSHLTAKPAEIILTWAETSANNVLEVNIFVTVWVECER